MDEIQQEVKELLKDECCECSEIVDTDGDHGWSNVHDGYLCWGCYESDQNHSSTVQIVDDGAVLKYHIGDHIRMDEFGDDMYQTNLTIRREYIQSSDWRGHYETTIEGWTEIMAGWTTGGWGDPIADRKAIFNQWAERLLTGEVDYGDIPIAIVADPTSNVFSMGISVLTPEPNRLIEWMEQGGDYLLLKNALS